MIDYSLILSVNFQGKQWAMSNVVDYSTLEWLDESTKPTQAELDALEQSTQDAVAKSNCKAKAKALLAASDWSVLPDVQITNRAAFDNYRAILRGYVISPVTDPTWPTEPQPVWG
jgi:hypothetical protein